MAEPVGLDVRHACLGGSADELADGVARSRDGKGNDQGLLTSKRCYQCRVIITAVVDASYLNSVRHLIEAAGAGNGRHDKAAVLENCIG